MEYRISLLLFVIGISILQGIGVTTAARYGWGTSRPACLAASRRGRRKSSSGQSGFATAPDAAASPTKTESSSTSTSQPKRIYSMPALYDLAFGYRNYEEEVEFLIEQHKKLHGGKAPSKTLELAAGPGRHTIAALQSDLIQAGTALDNSPEMGIYAREVAQHELDVDTFESSFSYVTEDMSDFQLSNGPFDSAWILLGSLQHLIKNEQVVSCFKSIHKALSPGGTLIIELPHPRETFSLIECTRNGWEVPLEDEDGEQSGELQIVWGDDDDPFDPIQQVRQFTVAMEIKGLTDTDPNLESVREIVPMRLFTAQEIDALATLSGFEVKSMHGALCDGVEVNDEIEAFRLVCVLQKI